MYFCIPLARTLCIYPSILLSFLFSSSPYISCVFLCLSVLRLVVTPLSWIILPWSNTEWLHSSLHQPFWLTACYWELVNVHTLPHINWILGLRAFFLDSWPLKMGLLVCPETSVRNYHYSLCNSPEEWSSEMLINFIAYLYNVGVLLFIYIFDWCAFHSMISGYLSPQHDASSGCGWRNVP